MRISGRKISIVAAHPDDEVIGAGAQLPLCHATVVHVTDGAPHDLHDALQSGYSTREEYAKARRRELLAALRLAGVGPNACAEIGIPDQQASLHLERLARILADLLDGAKPDAVITHPYEGGHPDHDSTAFAVRAARELLARDGAAVPELIEMTSYHDRNGGMEVYEFLPGGGEITTFVLTPGQRAMKTHMLDCFMTQRQVLKAFPVEVERFRAAPAYNFVLPPHAGTLYYERFDWGMTGGRWRFLAESALKALGLERVACGSPY